VGTNHIYKDNDYYDRVNLSGITWNGTTRILTLTNFSFTTSAAIALQLQNDITTGPIDTIIILNGTNALISTYIYIDASAAIRSSTNLTIQGPGSLTATAGTADNEESTGIDVSGNLTINNATVTATGGATDTSDPLAIIPSIGIRSDGIQIGVVVTTSFNGTVTMSGNYRAILDISGTNGEFNVPSGVWYQVANNVAGNGPTSANPPSIISGAHLWARLQYPAP
jgi:hypothetical protein